MKTYLIECVFITRISRITANIRSLSAALCFHLKLILKLSRPSIICSEGLVSSVQMDHFNFKLAGGGLLSDAAGACGVGALTVSHLVRSRSGHLMNRCSRFELNCNLLFNYILSLCWPHVCVQSVSIHNCQVEDEELRILVDNLNLHPRLKNIRASGSPGSSIFTVLHTSRLLSPFSKYGSAALGQLSKVPWESLAVRTRIAQVLLDLILHIISCPGSSLALRTGPLIQCTGLRDPVKGTEYAFFDSTEAHFTRKFGAKTLAIVISLHFCYLLTFLQAHPITSWFVVTTLMFGLSRSTKMLLFLIDLSQLHGPIPEDIGKLIGLEYLILSRNKVRKHTVIEAKI